MSFLVVKEVREGFKKREKIGVIFHIFFLLFLASKWSETSRNAKKILPLVRGDEGGIGGFGLLKGPNLCEKVFSTFQGKKYIFFEYA